MFRVKPVRDNYTLPQKAHETDAGWDVSATGVVKQVGDVTFFGTGIAVQPPQGYYFLLYPRSSISKTGYVMANSVGVIDQGYQGEVIVALRKVDSSMPNIQLGDRIAQLVPMKQEPLGVQLVEDFETPTERGDGGFGSSGK